MTIVGDSDGDRDKPRSVPGRCFYGSTPNYAFIWDEAGFEGTTDRIREKQKAGDMAGMAAQVTDDHLAMFAPRHMGRPRRRVTTKYAGVANRLVFYNPVFDSPDRFERTARSPVRSRRGPHGDPTSDVS